MIMDIKAIDKQYIEYTYARADVTFVRGEGSLLFDDKGGEYIDFCAGIAVVGLGHANKLWLEAVQSQLVSLAHTSNLYYSEPCAKLAEILCKRTGLNKVFFANSGAEANECAIKSARKYAVDKGKTSTPEIICLKNSFHGRTLATLTATGQDNLHKAMFAPFVDGFVYAQANDLESVRSLINDNTAAIMFELVQGEGGVIALDKEFVDGIAELCQANDILMVIDEVQTGNGRSGSLYAYMQYGINPDIVTTAKGLGNGLPIGACMFGEKTQNVLGAGDHGSTFGGNPAVCAGAIAVLNQIDDDLLEGVKVRHDMIVSALSDCSAVKSVSGLGLMLGIEIDNAKDKVKECLSKGLVVLTAHEKLRLLPALNIPIPQLEKGLQILKEVLK